MELSEKAGKVTDYIRECEKIIHKKGHELAQYYNLTIDQYHLLLMLNFSNIPPTIGEIAEKFDKAQNTISERISRLEEKGLVERIPDSIDRRISRVSITDDGNKLVETIRQERSNIFILNAISKMDESEVDLLIILLEELYLNLEGEV